MVGKDGLNMTGGSTAGYFNWSDVINEMGVLNFTFNNVFQVAITSGTSEGKGFYDLTEYYGDGSDAGAADEGLLSQSVNSRRKVGTYGTYGVIWLLDKVIDRQIPCKDKALLVMVMAMVICKCTVCMPITDPAI